MLINVRYLEHDQVCISSGSGKHGRLGHVIGTRNVTRSLVEKYTFHLAVFNNMGHGRKFKQMHLCADFNAGPSKE